MLRLTWIDVRHWMAKYSKNTNTARRPWAWPRRWTQQHAWGVYPSLIMLIISRKIWWPRGPVSAGRPTKIDDIKHFRTSILWYARKKLTVGTGRNRHHWSKVSSIMFHKFYPWFLLFPKLEMSIHGSRYHEVCSIDAIGEFHWRTLIDRIYFVTTQKLMISRCMKLLWYWSAFGRCSRYSFSWGRTRNIVYILKAQQ